MMEPKFNDLKVGDKMIRKLGGNIILYVIVKKIKGSVITVVPDEDHEKTREKIKMIKKLVDKHMGSPAENIPIPDWTFSAVTGGEIDIEVGWDGINTGSFLVKLEDNDHRPANTG